MKKKENDWSRDRKKITNYTYLNFILFIYEERISQK